MERKISSICRVILRINRRYTRGRCFLSYQFSIHRNLVMVSFGKFYTTLEIWQLLLDLYPLLHLYHLGRTVHLDSGVGILF